jgi:hypothetical protein
MRWEDDPDTLERLFALEPDDYQLILQARGFAHRLERALLLTWMRVEHVQVRDVTMLPTAVIATVARQLDLAPTVLAGFRSHQQTHTDAVSAVRDYLDMRAFTRADEDALKAMLLGAVAHTGHAAALQQTADDWLAERGVLRPAGETTIERLIYATRASAEEALFGAVAAQLSPTQRMRLDELCHSDGQESLLARFTRPARNASAPAILQECARLQEMRARLVDSIDWSEITLNRLRQWAAIVRRLSAQALRRYGAEKRAALLLAFLLVRCEEVTNIIVEMFDILVGRVFDKSDAEVANTKAQQAQILLRLIVVEGDGAVVKEGEHLPLPEGEAFEQIERGSLFESPPLSAAALRWGIGGAPSGEELLVAGDKCAALRSAQVFVPAGARLLHSGLHLQQRRLELLGPRLVVRFLQEGQFAQMEDAGTAHGGTACSVDRASSHHARSRRDSRARCQWPRSPHCPAWRGWRSGSAGSYSPHAPTPVARHDALPSHRYGAPARARAPP